MECPLIVPNIVERLFDFFSPRDLYKYQFVCKLWYDEARKRLKGCPTIDGFSVVTTVQPEYGMNKDSGMIFFRTMRNLFSSKKRDLDHLFERFILYWRGKVNYKPKNATELEKVLSQSFGEGVRCVPSFSFGHSSPPFENLMNVISFNYPTVRIECTPFIFVSELEQEIPFSRQPDFPTHKYGSNLYSLNIQAFHINRYASDHKVIVTDWYDPKSERPNLNDNDYPIKSLIYFVKKRNDKLEKIIEKYIENSDVTVSGAIIEKDDRISYNTSGDTQFKFTSAISIAFAGRQVEAAVFHHTISYDSICDTFVSELVNFRQNLSFALNDCRVIGFMYFENIRIHASSIALIWDKLVENLRGVELIGFDILSENSGPMRIVIHLIRI